MGEGGAALRKGALALVVAAGLLGAGAAPAFASDIDLYVSPDGTGTTCGIGTECSLNEAVSQANADSGDDVSIWADAGTYTPSSALAITAGSGTTVAIYGDAGNPLPPTDTVIDGAGLGGPTLAITGNASVDVDYVTLENGVAQYGDNVYADGSGNVALAYDRIEGGGNGSSTASVDESGSGYLHVGESTIEGDSGSDAFGLGMTGNGTVIVDASTISDNAGGGAWVGGGVSSGTVQFNDSTITGNGTASDSGDAGVIDYGDPGITDIEESTITDNGPVGVESYGPTADIILRSDILAGNSGSASADCAQPYGTIDDEGYDFADDDTCPTSSGASHDGESDSALGLAPLADAQSDVRTDAATEAITSSSVAHDAVPAAYCATDDERGAQRLQGAATSCDAGAFEVATPVTYTVSPTGSGSACSSGDPCALSEALTLASSTDDNGFAVTIALTAGTYDYASATAIEIESGDEASLTLDGAGPASTTIDGSGTTGGLLEVTGWIDFDVTLENLTLENGSSGAASVGGDLADQYDDATTTLLDDVLGGTTGSAGAVSALYATLAVDRSSISSVGGAPGVYAQEASVAIDHSLVANNSAGGVNFGETFATVDDSTLTGDGTAGEIALVIDDSNVGIYGTTIAANDGFGVDIVDASSQAELGGDVLAGNEQDCATSGAYAPDDEGYDFADDASCGFEAPGADADAGLHLGGLGSFGGPTETIALTSASDAYDVVPASTVLAGQSGAFCSRTDQRGVARIQGSATHCDAGAFQYAPPIVTGQSASSLDDGLSLTLTGSLLDSVTAATFGASDTAATISNQSAGSLTLTVPAGLGPGSEPITLTNADGATVVAFSALADPAVATTSLPAGEVGAGYSQTLAHSGGSGPYSFAIASGSLPGGLTLSSAGVISGTPTAAGTATFAVRVTDGAGGSSPAQSLSITIAAAPVPLLSITGSKLALKHGSGTVALACSAAPCTGSARLTGEVREKVHHRSRLVSVTLATGSYSVGAGQSGRVTLALTRKGASALAHVAKHPLRETLALTVTGGSSVSAPIKVS